MENAKKDSENINIKYEKYTVKVKEKYENLRSTTDKLKTNRDAAWKERVDDLKADKLLIEAEIKVNSELLMNDKKELVANLKQLEDSTKVFKDYVDTNMEDKQRNIEKLRKAIETKENDILNDLRQVGQSTPQTAYYFLNAVQNMSKTIQVNIHLLGGASNFTTTAMITIKSHFQNIEEIIAKPDDNALFWKDFLKF